MIPIYSLIAAYNRHGPAVLETPGRGQRQRAYLSLTQEQAVPVPFLEGSAAGQVGSALELKPVLKRMFPDRIRGITNKIGWLV